MKRTVLTEAEAEQVAEVFLQYRPLVEQVARRHGAIQDVPDIVQAVGIKLCSGLHGFQGRANIKTWLYRVTVNAARDHYAAQVRQIDRPRAVLEQVMVTDEAENFRAKPLGCPDQAAVTGERLAALRDAVDRLNPLHRELMREEIRGTGVYTYNRKSARYRARHRMRTILAGDPRVE